jgi:hypothetical protein
MEVLSMKDANDVAAHNPDGFKRQVEALAAEAAEAAAKAVGWNNVSGLVAETNKTLRKPIINGILRRGETMNFIASPKVGKSWMAYGLALSVVAGKPWLNKDWTTEPGTVAIIDNELHKETITHRISLVRETMGLPVQFEDHIYCCCLRGKYKRLDEIGSILAFLRQKQPQLLILDSLYRFIPPGVSENDNGAMMQMYNQIDQMSMALGNCGIVLIHHASKGNQSEKSVTDVGSGAGAQARAVDTHMVLRQHEVEDHFVLDGNCRTWMKPDPVVLEWEYPIWNINYDEDPTCLKGAKKKKKEKPDNYDEISDAEFITFLRPRSWLSRKQVIAKIRREYAVSVAIAEIMYEGVVSKHGLLDIDKERGIKDCGGFKAAVKRGGGLSFYTD